MDEKSKTPLHLQLYTALKNDISTHYQAGDKLPSIRKVATLYNPSKTTVESAYAKLHAEGYIESRPKSGYYVSEFYRKYMLKCLPKIYLDIILKLRSCISDLNFGQHYI